MSTSTGYIVHIPNSQAFRLRAEGPLQSWMDRFASILELEKAGDINAADVFFTRMKSDLQIDPTLTHTLGVDPVGAQINEYSCESDFGSLKVWTRKNGDNHVIELDNQSQDIEIVNMWMSLLPVLKSAISIGGLPLHAGLVEFEGRGFLLAAPGGVGKTTACERLPSYWKKWSDDETLITPCANVEYQAHPAPTWSRFLKGKKERSWKIQNAVPLAGICFLEQADRDEVSPIGQGRASYLLAQSAGQVFQKFWRGPKHDNPYQTRLIMFQNAGDIARAVPTYILKLTKSGDFWRKLEPLAERNDNL